MVIYTLAQIWKNNGEIYQLKNGNWEIRNADKIPTEILNAAQANFKEIEKYIISVEGMNAVDKTVWKMVANIAGWKKEPKINDFLCGDEVALNMFFEYQAKLATAGWNDIYEDWMNYENDETKRLKKAIYDRAMNYFRNKK